MLVHCCTFLDKINLVLQNDNMLKTHNLNSCKVLRCRGLWAALICCNQKQCSIHDSRSIKHCSHENVMPLFTRWLYRYGNVKVNKKHCIMKLVRLLVKCLMRMNFFITSQRKKNILIINMSVWGNNDSYSILHRLMLLQHEGINNIDGGKQSPKFCAKDTDI